MFTAAAPTPDEKLPIIQGDAKDHLAEPHLDPVDQLCSEAHLLSIEKAIIVIKQMLQSVNIDASHGRKSHTVFDQLVARGLLETKFFLWTRFEAWPKEMIYVLAQKNSSLTYDFFEYVVKTIPGYRYELLEWMAAGFARGGHEKKAFLLLNRPDVKENHSLCYKILRMMKWGFVVHGSLKKINNFLGFINNPQERALVVEEIVCDLLATTQPSLSLTEKSRLKVLVEFRPLFQLEMATELSKTKVIKPEEVKKLASEAREIRSDMLSCQLNFNQASIIRQPENRGFFLNFHELAISTSLARVLLFIVAEYLVDINNTETSQLVDFRQRKIRFEKVKVIQKALANEVMACAGANSYLLGFFNRDEKADAFSKQCREAESEEELTHLMVEELPSPSVAGSQLNAYQTIISGYYQQLKNLDLVTSINLSR